MAASRWPSQNKLTEADVALVYAWYAAGSTKLAIAKLFGVSPTYIDLILQGKRLRRQKGEAHHVTS